jgi:hypothetical protein
VRGTFASIARSRPDATTVTAADPVAAAIRAAVRLAASPTRGTSPIART